MTPEQIQTTLELWGVFEEARLWARGKDLAAIYACERGDWLYWVLPNIKAPKNVCVQLAVDAARLALPHAGELHAVCLEAIEAAEAWLLDPNEANVARCKAACDAAFEATRTYTYDTYASAAAWGCCYAARAAGYAADAAYAAHAAHATFVAYAAADAVAWVATYVGYTNAEAAYSLRLALADCFRARISYAEFVNLFTQANQ